MAENKKTLNFVYDNWIEEINRPINNGHKQFNIEYRNENSNYGEINFADVYHLVFSYNDYGIFYEYLQDLIPFEEKIELKKCRLQEVYDNPNENYYYFISAHGYSVDFLIREGLFDKFFNEVIKEHITKCKNFYLAIVSEHESESENSLILLNEYIKTQGVNGNQIYYINNNSILNELKEKNGIDINVYSLNFLSTSSTRVLEKQGECNYISEKNGKFFMCFNRGPKKHRYALLALLKKNNLLDGINWSLIPTYFANPQKQFYEEIFDKDEIDNLENEIKKLEGVRNVHFEEGFWWSHQDLWVLFKE